MDLDFLKVLETKGANDAQETIDVVFMYYDGFYHMDAAVFAKKAGIANNINLTNSYDNTKIKSAVFVKITSTPANQEAVKAAFTAGGKLFSTYISSGDMFIVKTTEGRLALVKVGVVVGTTDKGSCTFKVVLTTIP